MDEQTIENAIEKVDEILKPEKFNLVDAIKGRSYPEDSIRVFMDEEAAYLLYQTEAQLSGLSANNDKQVDGGYQTLLDSLQAEADGYKERIVASSLKFTLRGRDRKVYDEIQAQAEKDFPEGGQDKADAENEGCLAAAIVSVENAEGLVDDSRFSAAEIADLHVAMPKSEWNRLIELLWSLSFANSYFDAAVNAGFLSRR